MLQAGGDPNLLEESLRSERGGELGAQDLERDGPIVPEVVGEVDRGHTAASELALDAIAVGQGGREEGGSVGQGGDRRMPFLEGMGYRAKRGCPSAQDAVHGEFVPGAPGRVDQGAVKFKAPWSTPFYVCTNVEI
jgi:hypothetical protein